MTSNQRTALLAALGFCVAIVGIPAIATIGASPRYWPIGAVAVGFIVLAIVVRNRLTPCADSESDSTRAEHSEDFVTINSEDFVTVDSENVATAESAKVHNTVPSPPPLPARKPWSATRKTAAVLRLLQGEDAETLSREMNISTTRLAEWRDTFIASGQASLESRAGSGEDSLDD